MLGLQGGVGSRFPRRATLLAGRTVLEESLNYLAVTC
jgi:hypothetical protein